MDFSKCENFYDILDVVKEYHRYEDIALFIDEIALNNDIVDDKEYNAYIEEYAFDFFEFYDSSIALNFIDICKKLVANKYKLI